MMKSIVRNLLFCFLGGLFIVILASCKGGKALPGISAAGGPGELLLVMPEDWLKSEIGDYTKDVLAMDVPSLPQTEAWMRVQTVSTDNFGQFLRNTRNILFVDYNKDTYSKVTAKFSYDTYATGQLIVVLQTPSREMLQQYLNEHGRYVCELFLRHELFRMANDNVEGYSTTAMDLCMGVFKHRINVPRDVLSSKKDSNFLWLSNNALRKRYDIVIFSVQYSADKSLPSAMELISLRDSVLGKQIPGSVPQSVMTTTNYGAEYRIIELPNGQQYAELRGLWEMTPPDILAGPFVALAYNDKTEGKLYYIEGFVYYPNENKRDIIRMLQACLFSFRPEKQEKFDPEPLKRIKWGTVIDLTDDNPQFAHSLTPSPSL